MGPRCARREPFPFPFRRLRPGPSGWPQWDRFLLLPPPRVGQGEQRRFSGQALMWLRLFGS